MSKLTEVLDGWADLADQYEARLAAANSEIARLRDRIAELEARLTLAEKVVEAAEKAPLRHKAGCKLNAPAPFSDCKRSEWEQRQCSCGVAEMRAALAAWREGK